MAELQVSVIVPVYKAETYLRRCLDSIVAQTYQDFEVILIDDGSPDRSGAICDEYAAKDMRFHVFHQENQGVTKTRERGIEKAQGKYIFWVDADDYVNACFLEKVIVLFEKEKADIVVFGSEEWSAGKIVRTKIWKNQTITEWRRDTINGKLNNLWNFSVRRDFWVGEKAPQEMARAAADGYMVVRLFMKAQNVSVIQEPLYYYWRDNANSITHDFSGKRYQGNAYSWYYRLQICEKNYPEDIEICAKKAMSGAVKAFCMSLIYQDLSEDERKNLIQLLHNLSEYPMGSRIRDRVLRWAILHHRWWICQIYAGCKSRKSKKKNKKIQVEGRHSR